MRAILGRRIHYRFATSIFALVCLMLGGCFDEAHYNHSDFVSRDAGNAIAVNSATQTINPWPKEAQDSTINLEGNRAAAAVERYQDNKSLQPRGLNTTTVSEQQGPGAQTNTAIQH